MIPPLLLEVAAAVSPDDAEYEVSEHLPVDDSEHSYDIRWRLGGKDVEMRIDPALFTDMVNFGERMVRAELEHEARKVVAQLTGDRIDFEVVRPEDGGNFKIGMRIE